MCLFAAFFLLAVRLPSHFAERIHRKKTTIETNEYFCVFVLRTVNMWHARHKKMEKKKIALALGVMNSKPAYYSIVDRFGICFDLNTPPHHKFYFQMSNSSFFAILPIRYRIFFCSHFALVRFGFSIGVFQINAFRIRNFSHFFSPSISVLPLQLMFASCSRNHHHYQPVCTV